MILTYIGDIVRNNLPVSIDMFPQNVTPMSMLELIRHLICVKKYPSLFNNLIETPTQCDNNNEINDKKGQEEEEEEISPSLGLNDENVINGIIDKNEEEDALIEVVIPLKEVMDSDVSVAPILKGGGEEEEIPLMEVIPVISLKKRKQPCTYHNERNDTNKRLKREKYTHFIHITSDDIQPKLLYFTNDIYQVRSQGNKPGQLVNLIDHWIVNKDDNLIEWKVKPVIINRSSRRMKDKEDSSWFEKECNLIKYSV